MNLSARELEALEDSRLQSMEVVPNRYFLLVGFSSDIYMPAGAFFNIKTLLHTLWRKPEHLDALVVV